jgi:NitT/TauT family transport system substrate-binding protein
MFGGGGALVSSASSSASVWRWLCVFAGLVLVACTPAARPTAGVTDSLRGNSASPAPEQSGASAGSGLSAQPPAPRRLTVANTSLSNGIPFYVASDTGIFARYGLEVEVPLLSGVKSIQSVVARQAEYGINSARTTADAVLAGGDVVMVVGLSPTLNFAIYAGPEIARVADLRGKTIGITQFGASADFAARYALRSLGLEAERDYALFQTGGMPESFAAIQTGGIQAAVLSPPTTVRARKAGLREVLDIAGMNIDYVSGAVATNRDFLREEPDTTRRLIRALLEGIHFAKTNPVATKPILASAFQTTDDEVLEDTYTNYVERLLHRAPYVSLPGVKTVLDEAAAEVPAARDLAPERLVDNTWLAEIEASGFIKQLWGE